MDLNYLRSQTTPQNADLNHLRSHGAPQSTDLNTAILFGLYSAYPPGEWSWRISGWKKIVNISPKKLSSRVVQLQKKIKARTQLFFAILAEFKVEFKVHL